MKSVLVWSAVILTMSLVLVSACGGHDHHHGHDHGHDHHGHDHGHDHDHHGHDHHHDTGDDVKFRYSRAANVPAANEAPAAHQHTHHDHAHHHAHSHDHSQHVHADKAGSKQLDTQSLWTYALGSTLLISAAPFLILFFIPLQNNNPEYQPLLRVLLGFASGGLLGDALLHLLPHAVEYQNHHGGHSHDHGGHSHDHGHAHGHGEHAHVHDLTIWLNVLAGLFMFLFIEKFVRIANGGHSHDHGSHSDEASGKKAKESPPTSPKASVKSSSGKKAADSKDKKEEDTDSKDTKEESSEVVCQHSDIKITGYLNLVADFTHNFTDGLAIATSYMLGINTGLISTATILFHEVPHEIGDFSILIQSGFSKRKAMAMQLVTAVGALSGTLVGLMAQGLGDEFINLYILPFTAGGFIYIATVSVLPELLEDTSLKRSLLQVMAIFSGVFIMVIISWYE
jgi:zinc transporter 7